MSCCTCISQMDRGLVEKLGEFDRVLEPGCYCLNPITEALGGKISLKCTAINIRVDTKTKDNVLVVVKCSVHYEVKPDSVKSAFYTFSNPSGQISSYAGNVIRGQVPKMTIDELFVTRDEIQIALKKELDGRMAEFGYTIVATLIVDIDPIDAIKQAMSQINTNARLRQASEYKSDAEKIAIIKAAEGDAESKRLSGVGLAAQRQAAVSGLQQSVENFQAGVKGIEAREVMSLLLMNQYFDALKDIATQGRGTVVFTADSGSSGQVTGGMLAANAGRPSRGRKDE